MFTIQELATLRDLGSRRCVALVYNNRGYGEIRDAMDDGQIRAPWDRRLAVRPDRCGARLRGSTRSRVERWRSLTLSTWRCAALRSDRPTVVEYVDAS